MEDAHSAHQCRGSSDDDAGVAEVEGADGEKVPDHAPLVTRRAALAFVLVSSEVVVAKAMEDAHSAHQCRGSSSDDAGVEGADGEKVPDHAPLVTRRAVFASAAAATAQAPVPRAQAPVPRAQSPVPRH